MPSLPEPPPGQPALPAEPQLSAKAVATAWPNQPVLAATLPEGMEAEDLIGREVRSTDGDEMGTLRDLIIDLNSGHIAYAVVGSGGVFGLGETRRIVPMEVVRTQPGADGRLVFTAPLEDEQWDNAPRFNPDELEVLAQEDTRTRVAEHYQVSDNETGTAPVEQDQPIMEANDASTTVAERAHDEPADSPAAQQLVLASDLKGMKVQNNQVQVGTVDAILVSVDANDALVRLDPNVSTLGTNNQFVLPLARLSPQENDEDALRTHFDLLDFQRALPEFVEDPVTTAGE